MKGKIVTFGEVMMRLTAPGHQRFGQASLFECTYGGGEANVSMSLAHMGCNTTHVTRFPDNDLGWEAAEFLRKKGVKTNSILFGGKRLGLYFLENGGSVRPSRIVYDRSDSSFSGIKPEMINWEEVLDGADWFHWTGISPAISESVAETTAEALNLASEMGVKISADINYRKNLWQYGKSAKEVMPALISKCDLIICSLHDAKDMLDIVPDESEEGEISVYRQIISRFPNIRTIVNTTRNVISASHNRLSATLFNEEGLLRSTEYEIDPIIDRIGGGDAFVAGILYGKLHKDTEKEALEFAIAASVLKHTIEGDANLARVDEIENIMKGNTSGRLER